MRHPHRYCRRHINAGWYSLVIRMVVDHKNIVQIENTTMTMIYYGTMMVIVIVMMMMMMMMMMM